MNDKFVAGVITVPERSEALKIPIKEFQRLGIPYKVFMDENHNGYNWNMTRMILDFCKANLDRNVIIIMDDIEFKDGWFDKVNEVIDNTDYDVICMFTNRNMKIDDDYDIHKASYRMWFYDHCAIFRKGILNKEWFERFMEYTKKPERVKKELNHYDCMISGFLYDNGYKCGTVRPNYVRLQNVKSTLGHNIVIKEN